MNDASLAFQSNHTVVTQLKFIPDLLALHAAQPDIYPHLLSSAATGAKSRYDILFAFPAETLCLDPQGLHQSFAQQTDNQSFFTAMASWWQQTSIDEPNLTGLPFIGGWYIYLSYEMAAEVEPGLDLPADISGLPVALATRFQTAVVIDHLANTAYVVSEEGVAHQSRCQQIIQDCSTAPAVQLKQVGARFNEEPAELHLKNLQTIHQYIVDGDIFQANLSRLWQVSLAESITDSELYLLLKLNNPSPFSCVSTLPGGSIVSSSPERLVSKKQQRLDTRPIAGTRPRASDEDTDQLLSDELIAHPKERAEHIMLLDLERNDLGRVCVPGTIKVDELMKIESYQHVHHIVSNVSGQCREGVNPIDVIKAVFPGGTITGCPKVRCMEILAELEKTGRGAYTGSIGYINRNGDMDLNILIRTLVQTGQTIRFRAGGGIVVDSQPEHELAETRAKAKGMINALSNHSATSDIDGAGK
ncbi:MAG: aminodeoxychorismate synthase component I [Gammaproteobacteria bacterium]|nr:aminodeoxychorismate synthase component I [Gammaproteobacteria bacterium]